MNTQSLNISIVVSDLSDSGAGRWGGAVRPFLLSNALQNLGHKVKIVGFNATGKGVIQSSEQLPIKQIKGGSYPRFVKYAHDFLKEVDGDLIYAYKPRPTSFGLGLIRRWQTGKPLLLDIDDWELSWYGGDEWRYRVSPKQFCRDLFKSNGQLRKPDYVLYIKWLERLISKADGITINSQFLRDRFGGIYVPNGKDTDLFDPSKYNADAARAKYGLTNYRVLMFPGAPRPHKGVEDVLLALEKLNEPDLRLVIIGGSPYDDYDQTLQQRYGKWLIKIPRLSFEEMPNAVMAAHIVVVPQRDSVTARAQFPLKLSDGMAMGKPVISTHVGDIPEILADTGYLVEPSAPDQIAVQIQHIFHHWDEAVERGRRSRQRCIQHYDIASMGQGIQTAIDTVLAKRGHRQMALSSHQEQVI